MRPPPSGGWRGDDVGVIFPRLGEEVAMAYASAVSASPTIRIPRTGIPKLRWPFLSRRARSLFMIGLMISPAFFADEMGYAVQRLLLTEAQIAAKQAPPDAIPVPVRVFHVACSKEDASVPDRQRLAAFAVRHRWPRYPEAGPGCFISDRGLLGVAALKTFNVACPTILLSMADRRKWFTYATYHGWNDYPQAGDACVDP